jgi:hypothetical protein
MENKIFLGKYRVSGTEMELVGELRDSPVAYEGEEIESGRKVIVELVPALSLKPAVREQLATEATAAMKLTHANIPALYDFGVEDDQLIYVGENFDGTLAEEWVNTHGAMPVGAVLRIASQVVSALGAAAIQRITHHAINPANIVLVPGQTAEGEWPLVKVLHFVGVAPKLSGSDEAVAAFDKSAHYASPEQLQRGPVDFRSEIYSLGCTMWFLLTGSPPLSAANTPLAATAAKATDKLSGVPKAVRRLLAQMLSPNPNDRPGDPLAFYRQIQDCLAQVERRETMARRFGVAEVSTTLGSEIPGRRRFPGKALALAALLLTIATLAVVFLPGYLKHRRVVRAEEPIGVPIGVPDAAASAPPVNAAAANVAVSDQAQPSPAIVTSNTSEPVKVPRSVDNIAPLPTANDPAEVVSANQVAPAPEQPAPPAPSQSESLAPVVTSNTTTPPAEANSSTVAAANQIEPGPTQAESLAPAAPVVAEKEKVVLHEVRRAEPPEPEVRRAEPAPPEEGPANTTADTTIASEQPSTAVAQTEEKRDVEAEPATTSTKSAKRTDGETKATPKTRAKKTEPKTRPKANADQNVYVSRTAPEPDEAMPPLPRGSVRARFVGVTADGRWMLALPSRKIILVPPPPPEP